MASITKNQSGNWKAIVRKAGWPTSSKTFKRKKDAQDWARRIEDEMVRSVYIDRSSSERTLLKDALTRYEKDVSAFKAQSTHKREKTVIRQLKKELGDFSLAALKPHVVAEYRDKRLKTKNKLGKFNSTDQVRLELALISNLFTIARREWQLGFIQNPVSVIRKPRPTQRERRLNGDEEQRLLNACKDHSNPFLLWMVKLAILTCMRLSEISSLRREWIDFHHRVICLPSTITKTSETRLVPLSQAAVSTIKEVLLHPVRPLDTTLLFWGEGFDKNGTRHPWTFRKAWEASVKAAGLKNFRFHDLRHEAISRVWRVD